jgi:hypothetical protein
MINVIKTAFDVSIKKIFRTTLELSSDTPFSISGTVTGAKAL